MQTYNLSFNSKPSTIAQYKINKQYLRIISLKVL